MLRHMRSSPGETAHIFMCDKGVCMLHVYVQAAGVCVCE